eukprot:g40622.t1
MDDTSRSLPVVPSITDTSLLSIRFTLLDIKKWLETLDTAKGPDDVSAIVLKACAPEVATHLTNPFQYSYNTGIYLIMWEVAQ